ncbi:MAG: hypothetical protein ABEJ03_04840 [Candidatus Nanohaloarchaea archaeon]
MNRSKLSSAVLKGLIGSAIAVVITLVFHSLVISTSELSWALIAVTIGSFFSGFFAEYTDKIICEAENNDTKDNYITIASVFFILGITDVMDNSIASALYILGSILFGIAAYKEWEGNISDYLT